MKKILVWIMAIAALSACQEGGLSEKKVAVETNIDSVSYAVGISMAGNLRDQKLTELNAELIAQGILDLMNEKDLAIEEQACMMQIQMYMQQKQQEMMAERQKEADDNLAKGQEFLEANKAKEGVETTESGLQYTVMQKGSGKSPSATDKVKVHYHGTLLDGTVFDSSVERGEPISFPLNGVIAGWTEGLQLMQEGAKYKFFIPAELAYGPRGSGGKIGPNEALIFEVELIEVNPEE